MVNLSQACFHESRHTVLPLSPQIRPVDADVFRQEDMHVDQNSSDNVNTLKQALGNRIVFCFHVWYEMYNAAYMKIMTGIENEMCIFISDYHQNPKYHFLGWEFLIYDAKNNKKTKMQQ